MRRAGAAVVVAAAMAAAWAGAEEVTLRPAGDRAGGCALSLSVSMDACHYCLIDETPALDGDYVFSSTPAYAWDIYDLTDHATETGPIRTVELFARARAAGGDGHCRCMLILPGDRRYNGKERKLSDSWALLSDAWPVNPATGKRWQWSEIDALQVGLGLRSSGAPAQCSQLYVVVTYAPAAPPVAPRPTGSGHE